MNRPAVPRPMPQCSGGRRSFCTTAAAFGITSLASPLALAAGHARKRRAGVAGETHAAALVASYAGHEGAAAFATEVAARRELPLRWLLGRLDQARRSDAVRRLVMPPPAGTAKNWRAYRERFVERERIAAGLAFWRARAGSAGRSALPACRPGGCSASSASRRSTAA
ncbi:MAG: lytic murein transglycosylase [Rubrivivax sp.]